MHPKALQAAILRKVVERRKARASMLAFTTYVKPWFEVNWHHELICAVIDRAHHANDDPTVSIAHPSDPSQRFSVPLPRRPRRVMVFTPPRHGKSELVSVQQPGKLMGDVPTTQFMNITYGSDLAGTMSKSCVTMMQHEPYKRLYPAVAFERKAVERWKIKRKAEEDNGKDSMIASGIKSPLTGEGATCISIDDPFKNKSEAYSKTIRETVEHEYQSSIYTRRNPGGCSIFVTLTRWHEDDLAGRLIKRALKNKRADQWLVICLPATNDNGDEAYVWDTKTDTKTMLPAYEALWPGTAKVNEDGEAVCPACGVVAGNDEAKCLKCGAAIGTVRFNRYELDKTKAGLADPFWLAMYQQRPTNAEGNIFKRDKWGEVQLPLAQYDRAVHVWDTALEDSDEADFSAYEEMLYANGKFIISDADRDQMAFPELEKAVYAKWHLALERGVMPEAVLIENKGSGISLLQTIAANNDDPYFRIECLPGVWVNYRLPIVPMPAKESKEIRALSIVTYHSAGLVYLPAPKLEMIDGQQIVTGEAPWWVADFIQEHADFPRAPHDDWTDCTVHALTYYTRPVQGVTEDMTVVEDFDDVTLSTELDSADRW